MCTEAKTRKAVGVEGAQRLVSVVEGAWEDFVAEGRPRHRRTRANIVWENMVARADQEIAPLQHVQRVVIHETPWYVFNQRCALRLKLHTARLLTRNVGTNHQKGIAEQESLPGLPPSCRLSCGYTLDKAEAGIDRIVVTKRVRDELIWCIDVRSLAAGELEPVAPVIPGTDEGEPGIIIPLPKFQKPVREETDDHR